jgi:solute:Na+ symporter, SSS family
MLVTYLGVLLYVGRMGHVGRSRHTASDFFVAERSLGPFLLVMSVFGTTMTAFALVGSSGEAFQHGIGVYGLMASWSGIIHSACFFLIGVKLWQFGKRYGYTTQIQYFRDRFQSPGLGLLLFPILVGLVIPYIVINILGSGATIRSITAGAFPSLFPQTAGGIPDWLGAAAVCAVVLTYVFGGGMRSTAFANVLQTLILLGLGFFTLTLVTSALGGPAAASERVAETRPDLLVRGPIGGHEGHITHLHFLTYLFVPLSVAMFPHLFQHWMTARSAKTFRVTVTLHPVFIMMVWVPCIFLGVWASSAVLNGQPVVPPGLKNPNAVLGMMVERLTNPFLAGLLGVGIVSATMALDSQFLCLSAMFTHDVVLHHFGEARFSDKQQILMARLFVVATVVAAYLLALGSPRSVFTLGVWCFSGFSSLFPLVFAALYWKRVTKAGAMAGILAAAVVWVLLFADAGWGANEDYLFLDMMPVVTIFAASAIALVGVSLVTAPPSPEVIERFFPTRTRAASARTEPSPVPPIDLAMPAGALPVAKS